MPVMSVLPAQLNVLQHHYPVRGPLPVSLQPAAPYALPPQVPMHLHPALPLLQVPAVGAQGLPPPPPPPPPMQQGSQTASAAPSEGFAAQVRSTTNAGAAPEPPVCNPPSAFCLGLDGEHRVRVCKARPPRHPDQSRRCHGDPEPAAAQPGGAVLHHSARTSQQGSGRQLQEGEGWSPPQKGRGASAPPPNRVFVPQKQQIQEKAVNEVKNAIKPFYQRKEITKDEYKEIVRKAVEKVSTSPAPSPSVRPRTR